MFQIEGLEGVNEWPSENVPFHYQPLGNIVISKVSGKINSAEINILDKSLGIVDSLPMVNNNITIPLEDIEDAQLKRLEIILKVDETAFGGKILFLPETESEQYNFIGFIRSDGSKSTDDYYRTTDYINVIGATDISVKGIVTVEGAKMLYAYDEQLQPVKPLVGSSNSSVTPHHVVPDGTYTFIRACGYRSYDKSLLITFE